MTIITEESFNSQKGIHRFVLHPDSQREKLMKDRIRELKHQVKDLQFGVMASKWQPDNTTSPVLDSGSILRALISMDSILYLASAGYVGAINALIRQLYEFNVWSKIGLMEDTDFVAEATKEFYSKGNIRLSRYLKKINYSLPSISTNIATRIVSDTGRSIMDTYSLLTHATGIAQQCPIPTDDFYDLWDLCLNEVVIHYKCLLRIIYTFIRKEQNKAGSELASQENQTDNKLEFTDSFLFSVRASWWLTKILKYIDTVEKWYPSSDNAKLLQEIFMSDWTRK